MTLLKAHSHYCSYNFLEVFWGSMSKLSCGIVGLPNPEEQQAVYGAGVGK